VAKNARLNLIVFRLATCCGLRFHQVLRGVASSGSGSLA